MTLPGGTPDCTRRWGRGGADKAAGPRTSSPARRDSELTIHGIRGGPGARRSRCTCVKHLPNVCRVYLCQRPPFLNPEACLWSRRAPDLPGLARRGNESVPPTLAGPRTTSDRVPSAMTSWHYKEYILKGVFLGLLGLLRPPGPCGSSRPDRHSVGPGLGLSDSPSPLPPGRHYSSPVGLCPGRLGCVPARGCAREPDVHLHGVMAGIVVGVLSGHACAARGRKLAGNFGLTFDDIKHAGRTTLPDDDPKRASYPATG